MSFPVVAVRAGSPRLPLLFLLLLAVADDLGLDRADGGADERGTILRTPIAGAGRGGGGVLETRHHVAVKKVVALERPLAIRPLVRHLQEATEAPRLLL